MAAPNRVVIERVCGFFFDKRQFIPKKEKKQKEKTNLLDGFVVCNQLEEYKV